jgi:hypothetical protein
LKAQILLMIAAKNAAKISEWKDLLQLQNQKINK